jgi:potassium channel subfamily K
MNDLGLDRTIGETRDAVNPDHQEDRGSSRESSPTRLHWAIPDRQLPQFLQPTRWWITSTAIPLLAGTFGPMANAFSVISLAESWRYSSPETKSVEPGQTIQETIVDPPWVIVLNAVSLGCALIANFFLLLIMAGQVSFTIALPIVIAGWYISSVLLIGLLADVSRSVTDPNRELTQNYYYGAIAAGLYFVLASLLILTVIGAYTGHYGREFRLTKSQRTLMLQTIVFLIYLLAGSAIYARVEKWTFADAVYWSDFTLLTIGLGQPAPQTLLGQGLIFPFATGGILILGIVIGSIRALMIERGRKKVNNRLVEKTRQALVKKLLSKEKQSLTPLPKSDVDPSRDELERRKHEFDAMRKVRRIADAKHRWLALTASGIAVMMLWCLGAVIFWRSEAVQSWTYFHSLYFTYTTLLTIGYGDFYPTSDWGKPFFVFWFLLAVPTMTIFISNLADTVINKIKDLTITLGEVTILPSNEGFKGGFKELLRMVGGVLSATQDEEDGSSGEQQGNDGKDGSDENPFVERAGRVMEAEELREEQQARQRGDVISENIHHYQYLLIQELRKMFRYTNSSPPKRFSYEEWAYYLKLLGEDESVSHHHCAPRGSARGGERNKGKWSWIGQRSPLMGDREEAEWLLDALADKLEEEIKRLRDEKSIAGRDGKPNEGIAKF